MVTGDCLIDLHTELSVAQGSRRSTDPGSQLQGVQYHQQDNLRGVCCHGDQEGDE